MPNSSENIPTALVISELDDLSFCLCKQILAEKCLVKIIAKDIKVWRLAINNEELQGIEVFKASQIKNISTLNYLIYHLNFFKLNKNNARRIQKEEAAIVSLALSLAKDKKAKSLILLPSNEISFSLMDNYAKRFGENNYIPANTVLFDETIGPYFKSSQEGFFGKMAGMATKSRSVIVVGSGAAAPLCSAMSTARAVVRLLFSFGGGSKILITGPKVSSKDFFNRLVEHNQTIVPKEVLGISPPKLSVKQTILVDGPSDYEFTRALAPLGKYANAVNKNKKYLNESKKGILYLAFSIGLFLILPYLVLIFSTAMFIGAGFYGLRQNVSCSEKLISVSERTAFSSGRAFSLLIKLPFGKHLFGPGLTASDFLQKSANVGLHAVTALSSLETISERLFSKEAYDVETVSDQLFLELDFLYRELGFLQGEISSTQRKLPIIMDKQKILRTISQAREKISNAKDIAQELPCILGADQKRVYLLLFQNNMELRPTGGFIGSFAIAGVEKGRLVDIEIQDVYSADGQLKGHVEPPEPIKKYLGETGWYLRDSNWDPDFSVSAQRAEWFLDKELGLAVDGVVSLDLEAVKKLLDVVGEVEVPDFSKTISSKNLYEETRSQIEENYFPGSRIKANFLMAVASSLITKVSNPENIDKVRLGRGIVLALEERNIQVFLHNAPALKALENLGWTGGLPSEVCQNPCFGDWIGLAEANVGVNKANYYIERKMDMTVLLKEGLIKRTLTITWKNKADKKMEEKGKYKAYVRILVPRGDFAEGQKKIGQNFFGFSPELEAIRGHIEAGTLVEVFPQESSTVSFSWTSPAEIPGEKGEYVLLIRKQAGTIADRWEIEIDNQLGKEIEIGPGAFLTGTKAFSYNTLLARDVVSRISW